MRQIKACLVCGSEQYQEVLRATFTGTSSEAAMYFLAHRKAAVHGRIVRCCDCGFTYTNPQFEQQEYEKIYRDAARLAPDDAELLQAERCRGRRLASVIKRNWEGAGTLFDFGCGRGGFLSAIEGFDKFGFEVVRLKDHGFLDASIQTGNFLAMLGQEALRAGRFDVVTAFDVLEHLPDLDRYVRGLITLICPGGLLAVSVPNIQSFTAKLSGARWNSFLLEHLWYFSPITLRRFIESFGCRMIGLGNLPYDAPIGHILRRMSQTYELPWLNRVKLAIPLVVPIPAGVMYCIFRKKF